MNGYVKIILLLVLFFIVGNLQAQDKNFRIKKNKRIALLVANDRYSGTASLKGIPSNDVDDLGKN